MLLVNSDDFLKALVGGMLIGVAASLMLIWNGRVTGVSGIINGVFTRVKGEFGWRFLFIAGLFSGGLILKLVGFKFNFEPIEWVDFKVIQEQWASSPWWTVVAGLLVGFGTLLGSGCTSGHGVCGVSRFSIRSLLATLSFIFAGILIVFLFRKWGAIL